MKKIIKTIIGILVFAGIIAAGVMYYLLFSNNVKKDTILYIPHNSTFSSVIDSLKKYDALKSYKTFYFTAKWKKYPQKIKTGKYDIKTGMNNRQILNMLISHSQSPVNVYVPSVRTVDRLATMVAKDFEFSSKDLMDLLNNEDTLKNLGFTKQTVPALFLPDKYEFYWDYTAHDFLMRMYKEYQKFWNEERLSKAEQIGLTPVEVTTLASIVQAEQMEHPDERPRIAGLYLNRLKKGIPLQADPTVIFAIGDFSKKRVYERDTKYPSPYNTYIHKGLPPGPILIPYKNSIDAVLNYEKHNYYYMCAKEDFSGYHNFSKTLAGHLRNAKKYQQALNKAGIR